MPLPIKAVFQLMPEGGHERALLAVGSQFQAKASGEIRRPNRAEFRVPVEQTAPAVVTDDDRVGAVGFAALPVDLLWSAALPFDSNAIRYRGAPGHKDKNCHRERFHAADGSAKGGIQWQA